MVRLPNQCSVDDAVKLAVHFFIVNEKALVWTEVERRHFGDDYFAPVKIPMAHTLFYSRSITLLSFTAAFPDQ